MYQFVYWLKAIAAIFITNSHYADIWPVSALAFGGHLGNCLYFFVSGFCLCHIKETFPKWYLKRAIRIYPSLWICAAVFLLIGWYHFDSFLAGFHCLIYPTWFHFIGTIMLMYILFYIVRWAQSKVHLKTQTVMLVVLLAFMAIFMFRFDKTYYHIDDVNEKWVRFQFAESMLMGSLFREKYETIDKKIRWFDISSVPVMLIVYLASKLTFSRVESLSVIQCIHPMVLLFLIYRTAVLAVKLEKNGIFASVNSKISRIVYFLSAITLEIYLVQYPIIDALNGLPFPLNFLAVTALVLACAWVVHLLSGWVQKKCGKMLRL